jgi:hypothetical protein
MNPSSETTHATHRVQSSTPSELLHAKKRQVDGRERREAEEELEVQEEKINEIKLEEYVGSCINWMSLYRFIGTQ